MIYNIFLFWYIEKGDTTLLIDSKEGEVSNLDEMILKGIIEWCHITNFEICHSFGNLLNFSFSFLFFCRYVF